MISDAFPRKSVPAIEVNHLTVSYGPVPALLDVSLSIPRGQLVGVIGPNGSGKSTLIKSILGFVKPDVGEVKIFGEHAEKARGRVAYVPQRGSVDWDFPITVREVALMGRYGSAPWWRDLTRRDREITDAALEMVRMSEFRNRQIGQLSGGQQQRVAIARSLVNDPSILMADEPTGNLDSKTSREVIQMFSRLNEEQMLTIILVTHDLNVARHAKRILVLRDGLIAMDTPDYEEAFQLLHSVEEEES